MKYKQFDKLIGEGSANKVFIALQSQAYDIDTLGKELDLDRTSVFYHLKNLIQKKIVEKKMVGKRAYYGLIENHRNHTRRGKE